MSPRVSPRIYYFYQICLEIVFLSIKRTEGEGRITWQQLRWGEAPKDVEAIINLSGSTFMELRPVAVTNLSSDHVREKWQTSRWMTAKICQMYAQDRSQEGNPLKCYVQGSSYLYYHSNLESENMVWVRFRNFQK